MVFVVTAAGSATSLEGGEIANGDQELTLLCEHSCACGDDKTQMRRWNDSCASNCYRDKNNCLYCE